MDILSIMDTAAVVEDRAALLYHSFSQRFLENQAGFTFWEQLSLEEKGHADIVRTYRRQWLVIPCQHRSHPRLLAKLESIQAFIVRELREPSLETISRALETAVYLETMMQHSHLAYIQELGDPILTKLLNRLGHEDQRHREWISRMSAVFPRAGHGGAGQTGKPPTATDVEKG